MSPLFERMRPQTLSEIVGQSRTINRLTLLLNAGTIGGRAYMITGPSGSGKTTIANVIARHVADDYAIEELDAASLTPKAVQDWERRASGRTLGKKGGWALLVNECHGLRKDTVRQFLVTLERLPRYAVVVFTTTSTAQRVMFDECIDAGPLTSRCVLLPLDETLASTELSAAILMRDTARSIGLDGRPLNEYVDLYRREHGNWRACWNHIESGGML